MAVESGKDGKILIGATPIADITGWEFDKECHTTRYGSSATGGFRKTVAGVKQGQGTIEFKWDSAAASPILEGTSATLLLHLNATEKFTIPAIIKNFRVRVDINTGEVTAGAAAFETDGAWTEPTLS
jgi:hypothetical protein